MAYAKMPGEIYASITHKTRDAERPGEKPQEVKPPAGPAAFIKPLRTSQLPLKPISMMELIHEITKLDCIILKRNPPYLIVSAEGNASTGGWTCPLLVPMFVPGVTPKGGNYEFEFMAIPPSINVPDVLSPVKAEYLFTSIPSGLQQITVKAKTNSMEHPISGASISFQPEELQDLRECTGTSDTGSFQEALHNARIALAKVTNANYIRGEVVSVRFAMGGYTLENTVSVTVREY